MYNTTRNITMFHMLNSKTVEKKKNVCGKKNMQVNNITNREFSSRNISLCLLAEVQSKLKQSSTQIVLAVQKWKASMILRLRL